MASTKEYLDFVMEQLSGLDETQQPGNDGRIHPLLPWKDFWWDI